LPAAVFEGRFHECRLFVYFLTRHVFAERELPIVFRGKLPRLNAPHAKKYGRPVQFNFESR
jgi:hypothetical protein